MPRDLVTIAIFQQDTGWSLPQHLVDRIKAAAPDNTDVAAVKSMGPLLAQLPDTTHLIGFPLTTDQFTKLASRARFLQLTESIADSSATLLQAADNGLTVATATPFRAPQTAEHAAALTLAVLRNIDHAVEAQAEHRWAAAQLAPEVRTLKELTVGVIAMGPASAHIKQRLEPFGARVIRTDATNTNDNDAHPIEHAPAIAAQSDILIVAAPHTPRTHALIDRAAFKSMKNRAVLVDVSRGGVVVHDALLDALRNQRIAAAALDGFRTRPLPPSSPLWTMPNVIITPGIAAASNRYWDDATDTIADNIARLANQQPPHQPLDPAWFHAPR